MTWQDWATAARAWCAENYDSLADCARAFRIPPALVRRTIGPAGRPWFYPDTVAVLCASMGQPLPSAPWPGRAAERWRELVTLAVTAEEGILRPSDPAVTVEDLAAVLDDMTRQASALAALIRAEVSGDSLDTFSGAPCDT